VHAVMLANVWLHQQICECNFVFACDYAAEHDRFSSNIVSETVVPCSACVIIIVTAGGIAMSW
jgi:hypothetical protein